MTKVGPNEKPDFVKKIFDCKGGRKRKKTTSKGEAQARDFGPVPILEEQKYSPDSVESEES